MNKTAILLACLLVVCSAIPLFSDTSIDGEFYELSIVLTNNKSLSDEQVSFISKKAKHLSEQQRALLFASHQQSATIPALLNFFVGGGVGSFVQGDRKGGWTGLAFDLSSLLLLSAGLYYIFESDSILGEVLTITGATMAVGSRIGFSIRPFIIAKEQNRRLAESLNVNVALIPFVDKSGDFKMQIAAGFSF